MALNFQPDLVSPHALRTNRHAVERHLNDDHYVRGFTPDEFVLDGVNAVFAQITGTVRWPTIKMPDAVVSSALTSFRKPSEWRSGKLKVSYWYTAAVGSTNNFNIGVTLNAIRRGEVVNGTALYAVDTAVAGPAVANTLMLAGPLYSTTSFGSDDELFSLGVFGQRTSVDDTNANDFYLVYVVVEHIPAQQVSQ